MCVWLSRSPSAFRDSFSLLLSFSLTVQMRSPAAWSSTKSAPEQSGQTRVYFRRVESCLVGNWDGERETGHPRNSGVRRERAEFLSSLFFRLPTRALFRPEQARMARFLSWERELSPLRSPVRAPLWRAEEPVA